MTETLRQWLNHVLRHHVKRLTDDEQAYLETVNLYLFHKRELTEDQIEILERIQRRLKEKYE